MTDLKTKKEMLKKIYADMDELKPYWELYYQLSHEADKLSQDITSSERSRRLDKLSQKTQYQPCAYPGMGYSGQDGSAVFDDRDTVFSAIQAGASGYVLKGSTPREIVEALFELENGGAPMSPKIARAVIREFQESKVEEQYLLTPREQQILKGLETGLTYTELGDILSISPHTVHSHIKRIYEKLHAVDRKSALIQARRKGLI